MRIVQEGSLVTPTFKFPKPKHECSFLRSEHDSFRIKPKPRPHKWAEEHWSLTKIYAEKGKFKCRQWQKFVLDLVADWNTILIVAPVRMGKTMLKDIMRGYCIDQYDMGGMIVYPNHILCTKNLKLRIIPTIKEIPVLRKYWSGKEDDLSIENIILRNSIWNVASAQNKNELATFGAQFVDADEIAKWEKMKHFDPWGLLVGRQKDYKTLGMFRLVGASSPFDVGDTFYNEVYKQGNLILTPHVQCPYCRQWFEWSDHHIREVCPEGKTRKDPVRIIQDKESAVKYECPSCKHEINEVDHLRMNEDVVWAAPEIEKPNFKQKAETILPSGEVVDADTRTKRFEAVVVNWNRLIDPTWKFYECLAAFFESFRSPMKRKAYENEDMARFFKRKSESRGIEYFMKKRAGYRQYGPDAVVPDEVLVLECCFDTQDNGFYYRIRGWGRNMETWLIRHDFIETPMDEKMQNKAEVYQKVIEDIGQPLKKKNGESCRITFGFIDRGGHRSGYVEYLCDHIPWLHAYVGNTRIDPKQPLIKKSRTGNFYLGQTELLSEIVEQYVGLNTWHLPDDVTEEYLTQLTAQYWTTDTDEHGQIKRRYIRLPKDHYRDTENMGIAVVKFLDLEDKLFSDKGVELIKKFNAESKPVENKPEPEPEKKKPKRAPQTYRPPVRNTRAGWLNNVRRRR